MGSAAPRIRLRHRRLPLPDDPTEEDVVRLFVDTPAGQRVLEFADRYGWLSEPVPLTVRLGSSPTCPFSPVEAL
jgi:hypothetical protein